MLCGTYTHQRNIIKKVLEKEGATKKLLNVEGKGALMLYFFFHHVGILFLRLLRIPPTPSSKLYLFCLLDKANVKMFSD